MAVSRKTVETVTMFVSKRDIQKIFLEKTGIDVPIWRLDLSTNADGLIVSFRDSKFESKETEKDE